MAMTAIAPLVLTTDYGIEPNSPLAVELAVSAPTGAEDGRAAEYFRPPESRSSAVAVPAPSTSIGKTEIPWTPGSLTLTTTATTSTQRSPPRLIVTPDGPSHAAIDDGAAVLRSTSAPIPAQAAKRKPSPGLAARLKALGFGSSATRTPPSQSPSPTPSRSDTVGRLPAAQIRQLEQHHQGAAEATAIERRGRPWKGKGGIALPSLSGLRETTAAAASAIAAAVTSAGGSSSSANSSPCPGLSPDDYRPPSSSPSLCLPEIAPSEPLTMDTNKYRLPDHTNGNGTKTQLDTRREHIRRDSAGPSPSPGPEMTIKDLPPLPTSTTTAPEAFDATLFFNPLGLQRPGSIYTLSRASFANQLAQLTSLQLPDADSLSSKVSAIPTAPAAAKALINAADQIRGWVSKASEVIGGLDSDDDVEWAAAGGREGLEEVENAIDRFEELITVYVTAIESLQAREDIADVSSDDLRQAVTQMESIMQDWMTIKNTLHEIKGQVEIAMEWEELWNSVLGDIQTEMDELGRLMFEMEERRHKSMLAVANGDNMDVGDLETIVEETPPPAVRLQASNTTARFGLVGPGPVPGSPPSPSVAPAISQDDSTLMSLFARMQPLRASLDFLPMRLSVFEGRAQHAFPTACEELEMRRNGLDGSYRKLEKDAQSLQKELGEDRWVVVFRGAGRQAQKMCESVEKSVARLKEAVDGGMHLTNQPLMSKRLEAYENRKMHYGPAIERVLSIIDRGVKDRLTVNGEIVRLHQETQTKWEQLKERMRDMDGALEDLQADKKSQQLRDSISSMLSNDRSTVGSGNETPGSSPPSSVIMASLGLEKPVAAAPRLGKSRSSSVGSHLPQPGGRRNSSMPTPTSQVQRKPLSSRMSTLGLVSSREGSVTPVGNRLPRPASTLGRPRWNSSTNTSDVDTGHHFKPMSLTSPSPYARATGLPTFGRSTSALGAARESKLPLRSPLSRAGSASPVPDDTPSKPPSVSTNRRMSTTLRDRLTSPGPTGPQPPPQQQQPLPRPPRLASHSSMSALNNNTTNRRASMQPQRSNVEMRAVSATAAAPAGAATARPASSLATSSSARRASLLPQPKGAAGGPATEPPTGRASPQAVAGARMAMRNGSFSSVGDAKAKQAAAAANKPKWR